MANGLKGEVPFSACGSEWTLVMDFNAICSIDTELGIGIDTIGAKLSGSAPTIRSVFRIGLEAKHDKLTDIEAGRLIGDIGPAKAAQLIAEALQAAFPEVKQGNVQTPTKKSAAKGGTGKNP